MKQLLENPKFADDFYKKRKAVFDNVQEKMSAPCTNPLLIPVAVHYNGNVTEENAPCLIEAAQEQVNQMNLNFSACNANAGLLCEWINAGCANFGGAAGGNAMPEDGACMRFCLADQNLPTGEDNIGGYGITVGDYSWTGAADAGPTWSGFLNIFVGDYLLDGGTLQLGIAPLDGGNNPNGDGIYVLASAFGSYDFSGCTSGIGIGDHADYNEGATAVHETGHYFGLNHTFEEFPEITDTPPQSSPNLDCPSVDTGTCTSTADGYSGNFMDFVDDACMHNFTAEQAAVMEATAADQSAWRTDAITCAGVPAYEACNTSCPVDFCKYVEGNIYSDFGSLGIPNCATGCNPITLSTEVWGNEAYFLGGLTANETYTFEFCTGYNPADWAATITITSYDVNTGIAGTPLFWTDGCTISFTPALHGDYAAFITVEDNCGGSVVEVFNGLPSLQCSGTQSIANFTDEGGFSGNYLNDQNNTYTFCPDDPTTTAIQVEFLMFDLENEASCSADFMTVYDGNGTGGTVLGVYCGTNSPGTLMATDNSGCLTFVFTSNASVTASGWAAIVSCDPCPPFYVLSVTEDNTSTADYETYGYIESTQLIENGAQVDYDAVDYIEMTHPFCVELGAEFHAFIDGCDSGGGGIHALGSSSDTVTTAKPLQSKTKLMTALTKK